MRASISHAGNSEKDQQVFINKIVKYLQLCETKNPLFALRVIATYPRWRPTQKKFEQTFGARPQEIGQKTVDAVIRSAALSEHSSLKIIEDNPDNSFAREIFFLATTDVWYLKQLAEAHGFFVYSDNKEYLRQSRLNFMLAS